MVSIVLVVGLSIIVGLPTAWLLYMQVSAEVKGFFSRSGGQSPAPFCRFNRVGGISLAPLRVTGWSVNGRNILTRHSQPRLYLGPVMASVEDSPPEYPNSFSPQAAEKVPLFEPPRGRSIGKNWK